MNQLHTRESLADIIDKTVTHFHRSYQLALLKLHYQPSDRPVRAEEARPPVPQEIRHLLEQLSGDDTINIFRQYESRYDAALHNFSQIISRADRHSDDNQQLLNELREDARQALSVVTSILKELNMHIFPLTDTQLQDCIGSARRIA